MRKQFVWLGVVTLVVLVGWFAVAYRPARARLGDLRADVQTTQQEVSALEAKVERLLELQRNENGAKDQADRLVNSLPNDPKLSDFIIQVQDAANAAKIDFLTITPGLPAVSGSVAQQTAGASTPSSGSTSTGDTAGQPTTSAGPTSQLRSITVQIKADGEYFEIEDFTLKLETLSRAVRIDDFTLGSSGDGNMLSASIKLQMFMMAPPSAAGAAPGGQAAQATTGGA